MGAVSVDNVDAGLAEPQTEEVVDYEVPICSQQITPTRLWLPLTMPLTATVPLCLTVEYRSLKLT